MPTFNPLDHPICFSYPLRLALTACIEHLPFAMALVGMARPGLVVELGMEDGISYSAFCQAIKYLKLDSRCFGIQIRQKNGDQDPADQQTIDELREHHTLLYKNFSSLLQTTEAEALSHFEDGTVDLLQVGNGSSAKLKERWQSWRPKLSERGVLLFPEINKREHGAEAWKVWEEIKPAFPHFEFAHSQGLGVLAHGPLALDGLRELLEAPEPDAALIREFFRQLGERLKIRLDGQQVTKEQVVRARDQTITLLETELNEERWARKTLSTELEIKVTHLTNILNSRAWRWVSRYGHVKDHYLLPVSRSIRQLLFAGGGSSRLELFRSRPGVMSVSQYRRWIQEYDTLTDADRAAIRLRIDALQSRPLISIIMPVHNVAEQWLRAALDSVRRQLYTDWELCVVDDHSSEPHIRKILEEYERQDRRIKLLFREQNGHISVASNSALELVSGEFTALLDHDDELAEHALYLVAEELNSHPRAKLIYSDEDKLNEQGERFQPHFKTDWNPDLFYSMNFISHLGVYRTSILKKIGGFRPGFEGSQDYDLALRFIEEIPEEHIRHIPHVLYHWRAIPGSAARTVNVKGYAFEAGRKALRSHFERRKINVTVTEGDPPYHRVIYPIPDPPPLVSVIIGTRDGVKFLRQAVEGILRETDYDPLELIIVDNQSVKPETLRYFDEIGQDERVRIIRYDAPFNFSAINNLGARQARGEILGLVNSDIKVISAEWLKEMVGHALRPEIGAVGAKLYYENETIQHAGVIIGLGGIAGHAHKRFPRRSNGYFSRAKVIQNFSAVTAACMVLRRRVFEEVGGLNEENLPVAFNDVDFCLRIRKRGYRILWTPYAELYHLESALRGPEHTPERWSKFQRECAYIWNKWGHLISNDPYYNPNLTMNAEDLSLASPPRTSKPWKR